jgi:uncharacterized protein involved in propanediol utilization
MSKISSSSSVLDIQAHINSQIKHRNRKMKEYDLAGKKVNISPHNALINSKK